MCYNYSVLYVWTLSTVLVSVINYYLICYVKCLCHLSQNQINNLSSNWANQQAISKHTANNTIRWEEPSITQNPHLLSLGMIGLEVGLCSQSNLSYPSRGAPRTQAINQSNWQLSFFSVFLISRPHQVTDATSFSPIFSSLFSLYFPFISVNFFARVVEVECPKRKNNGCTFYFIVT